jgi:hypothetical protein
MAAKSKRESVQLTTEQYFDLESKQQEHINSLQRFITYCSVIVFSVSIISTLALIFLIGFKAVSLPDSFLNWLGGATIGELGGLLLIVYKSVFSKK